MLPHHRAASSSWIRIPLLAGLSALGGGALTFALLVCTEGLRSTTIQAERVWVAVQEVAAPALVRIDRLRDEGISEEDMAVYRAILDWHLGDRQGARLAVCRETEWPYARQTRVTELVSDLQAGDATGTRFDLAAIRDFFVKNQRSISLSSPPSGDRAVLIGSRVVDRLMADYPRSWEQELSEAYAGASGFLVLSRPGYDFSHQIAVVYVSLDCGALCGHGGYFQLARHGDSWDLVAYRMKWVA